MIEFDQIRVSRARKVVYVSFQGRRKKVIQYDVLQCTLAPHASRLNCSARWIFYAFLLEDVFKACARKCVTLLEMSHTGKWLKRSNERSVSLVSDYSCVSSCPFLLLQVFFMCVGEMVSGNGSRLEI